MFPEETKEKSKPLTYEQIRDIVLEKKEDVKDMAKKKRKSQW